MPPPETPEYTMGIPAGEIGSPFPTPDYRATKPPNPISSLVGAGVSRETATPSAPTPRAPAPGVLPSTPGASTPGAPPPAPTTQAGQISSTLQPPAQQQITPEAREVGDNELVSKNLTNLLDENSAYIQNARKSGVKLAADRGLQNSTMAAGAGVRGAISQALPIAASDAQAYQQAASANQAQQFEAQKLNVTSANTLAANTYFQDRAAEIDAQMQANQFDYNKVLTQMDIDSREALQRLQNDFAEQAASKAEAAQVVRGTLAAIAAVVTTPGITPAEITRATDIIIDQSRAALSVMDVDLAGIFGPVAGGGGGGGGGSGTPGGNIPASSLGGMVGGASRPPGAQGEVDTSPGEYIGEIRQYSVGRAHRNAGRPQRESMIWTERGWNVIPGSRG